MLHARRITHFALALCLIPIAAQSAKDNEGAQSQTVTAVWSVHELEFNFRSQRAYSCEGLREKITAILVAVGAHDSADVRLPCVGSALLSSALVTISLARPVEATPENVTAVTTYSQHQLLVARLYKLKLPSANDIERFDAEWRTVALHNHRGLRLDAGDCELLQDLSTQVFPQMGVRLEGARLTCPSAPDMRSKPRLQVKALVATPKPQDTTQGARR